MKTMNEIKRTLAENRFPCPMFIMDELEERDEHIEHLRSALAFYGAKDNYDKTPFSTLLKDGGKKARQALGLE